MKTCRHFRYRLPHEVADELRDSDPLPCEICDSWPSEKCDEVSLIVRPCDSPDAMLLAVYEKLKSVVLKIFSPSQKAIGH
jgi:hypothetical protein